MRSLRHITLIFLLIVATLTSGVSFVSSQESGSTKEEIKQLNQEIELRKSRIKELEETIEKYKNNIKIKQTEAVSLRNQLNILDNRIAQMQADIELTVEQIKQTQLEIDALKLSIAEKEKTIAKQKKIIAKMVQQLNANDKKNTLEILITYDNFADFYSEYQNAEKVYVDIGRSVKSLRLAKEELQAKKSQVEGKKLAYVKLQEELQGKKDKLEEQSNAKQTLLFETKASEAKYQTLLASLRQQYQAIEGEVRSYEEQVRKKLEEQEKIKATGDVAFGWPTPSRFITAYFHDPSYPFRNVFEHNAIDIRAAQGTPIRAAAAGYVARARRCSSPKCYSYVLIVHTGEISTVYGHLSQASVTEDQFVNRGDVIGYSGGTPGTNGAGPFVTGAHLHFEVRQNGIPVDPLGYLAQ